MREVSYRDYLEFVAGNKSLIVEGSEISLYPIEVERFSPTSEELTDVSTTVWSFPVRGSWGTHKGDYRGNWPPQMVRALIEMYTSPGEVVLDQMVGGGTTCVEARILGRNCIGVDINYNAVILTLHRLYWLEESVRRFKGSTDLSEVKNISSTWSKIYYGDARELSEIGDDSVDLIATHPPYWNIIDYGGRGCSEGDLSCVNKLEDYLRLIDEVAEEAYRVLKPGRYLGILVGDTRVRKHHVPITYHVLKTFMEKGFILKEEVIKIQHKMKTTREVWSKRRGREFLLIYHEKLFIFRKPVHQAERKKYRLSSIL